MGDSLGIELVCSGTLSEGLIHLSELALQQCSEGALDVSAGGV